MTREFEIVVAGSGIAGLSAGLGAARLGRKTLVITGDTLGGHLLSIEKIDGYPGFGEAVAGYDLCPTVQEQASAAGAEFSMAGVTRVTADGGSWHVETPKERYTARALIIATGTRFKELGVPGEALLHGKGVSQCASCDAPLLREKEAVVVGGGDSALQEALTLAEHCSRVTIVHRGAALSGQAAYCESVAAHPRVVTLAGTEVSEILGDSVVTGVSIESSAGEKREIECAGVFVFIGLQPNTALLDDDDVLDGNRCIVTDVSMRTRLPGLFAAGTVRAGSPGRAAAASGDGMAAAVAAHEYLEKYLENGR